MDIIRLIVNLSAENGAVHCLFLYNIVLLYMFISFTKDDLQVPRKIKETGGKI